MTNSTEDDNTLPGGDDAADSAPDPLAQQVALAKARKEIAEALAAERDALAGDTKGREGKVEVGEGAGFYADFMAWEALSDIAGRIKDAVKERDGGSQTIVVTTEWGIAERVQRWRLLSATLDALDGQFDRMLAALEPLEVERPALSEEARKLLKRSLKAAFEGLAATGTVLASVTGLLGAAAGVASFFRSDLKMTSRPVTLADEALVSILAQQLGAAEWTVKLPRQTQRSLGPLGRKLETLIDKRSQVIAKRDARFRELQPQLDALATLRRQRDLENSFFTQLASMATDEEIRKDVRELRESLGELDNEISVRKGVETLWNRTVTEIDAVLAAFDALATAMQAPEGASSLSALQLIEVLEDTSTTSGDGTDPSGDGDPGERKGKKSGAKPDLLCVKVTGQGGEVHVREGMFRTRLGFVGGASVAFFHTDATGRILASGNVPAVKVKTVRIEDLEQLQS